MTTAAKAGETLVLGIYSSIDFLADGLYPRLDT
jgi:hypothetical protein